MEKRTDRRNGNLISLLGFGCMRFPLKSQDMTDIDEDKVFAMVDYAMQHGINYYDTALPYHGGRSEVVIGKALARYPRESFFLADKMPIWSVTSEAEMETLFAEQLAKCRTAYFDYYLVHNITANKWPKIEELKCFDFLNRMKQEGKIRNLGFSFHDGPPLLEKVVAAHPWDFAQIQLNYLDWQLQDAKTQYEILVANNLPVIVMEPLRGGSLVSLCPATVSILREAAPASSIGSWALRFAASQPEVITVLSGMTEMEHLVDNVNTMTGFQPMTAADYAIIDRALAAYRQTAPVPCTSCQYCQPCPFGVDIPRNFGIYNHYLTNGKPGPQLLLHYNALPEKARAGGCVGCGACLKKCPQHINIPDMMTQIKTEVGKAEAPAWI